MSAPPPIQIVRVTHKDLPKFEAFLRNDAIQAEPSNPDSHNGSSPDSTIRLAVSISLFRLTLAAAAEIDGQYVGYLTAVRIHKVDERIAVLFIDELMVLSQYRRRGVASTLLREVQSIAKEIGAWRVRLCVDPDNHAARELYLRVGLEESHIMLCQQDLGM